MLELKRRRFLQIIGAAGVAPAIPALSTSAAMRAPAATHAQMLWASLASQGGAAPSMVGVSKAMGVSGNATRGICAKLVQANLVSARHAAHIGHAALKTVSAVKHVPVVNAISGPRVKVGLVKFLFEDADDAVDVVEQDTTDSIDDSA